VPGLDLPLNMETSYVHITGTVRGWDKVCGDCEGMGMSVTGMG